MLLIIWCGLAPAIGCGGCALACGAPLGMAGLLAFAGLLSGWTGGGIAASAYDKLLDLANIKR